MLSQTKEFLSQYPAEIASLASKACNFVAAIAPDVVERVQSGWKVVIFEYNEGFCAVAPHGRWVNLQFYAGSELPDPTNLLEGTGKAMRHVKIRQASDLSGELSALIAAAAKLARV